MLLNIIYFLDLTTKQKHSWPHTNIFSNDAIHDLINKFYAFVENMRIANRRL